MYCIRHLGSAFAALGLLGLASPAAALTLDLTFITSYSDATGSETAPMDNLDEFHIVITFEDRVDDPIVVGEDEYQPISRMELFAGGPDATVWTQANTALLGWDALDDADPLGDPYDSMGFVMAYVTGDLVIDELGGAAPTGPDQSGTVLDVSLVTSGPTSMLDGDGPDQFLKLGETPYPEVWISFANLVSVFSDGEWVWETAEDKGEWLVVGDFSSVEEVSSPVPIPAAGLLLPGALAALSLVARRRRA